MQFTWQRRALLFGCIAASTLSQSAMAKSIDVSSPQSIGLHAESASVSAPEAQEPLHSGLKLSLIVLNGELPADLTYSIDKPEGSAEVDSKGSAIAPGVYEVRVQSKGQEVFRRSFMAMKDVQSNLDLRFNAPTFELKQSLNLPQIKFMPNQKKVAKGSIRTVNALADLLKDNDAIELFSFDVHTDSGGQEEMNLELTQARAIEVRNLLVKKGIDPQRIRAKGWGSSEPLPGKATNDAANRRVEFLVLEATSKPRLLGTR